jgi:hypothetical protein
MLRKHIRSEILKGYFNSAWSCLPADTRHALIHFIRQVREVDRLESATISCPDGSRVCLLKSGDAFAFLYKDDQVAFCDILLAASLAETRLPIALGVVLYELAHARDYLAALEGTAASPENEADSAAWDQAIRWAKDGIPHPDLMRLVEFWGKYAKIQALAAELSELAKLAAQAEKESPLGQG